MAAVGDAAERALLELVKSWPLLDGALERIDHVLNVRIAECESKRTLAYLGVSLWKAHNFDRALSLMVGEELYHPKPPSVFEILDRARAAEDGAVDVVEQYVLSRPEFPDDEDVS
jgi:hypothetical protein